METTLELGESTRTEAESAWEHPILTIALSCSEGDDSETPGVDSGTLGVDFKTLGVDSPLQFQLFHKIS